MNIDIHNKTTISPDLPHDKCLNCDNDVTNNFCTTCGQKKSTHRYSLEHFLVHDLVHGVFHLDKGFFFTVRELLSRPGHSLREFIGGKRVAYYNYFSFALIILVIEYYLNSLTTIRSTDFYKELHDVSGYRKVAKDYYKIAMLGGIPFLALVSYLFFIKAKQNYTEHLIINIYRISVVGIFTAIYNATKIFCSNKQILYKLFMTLPILEIAYSFWLFYQYFSMFEYKKTSLIFRSLLVSIVLVGVNNGFMKYLLNEIGKYFFR
jgi:hypothetical protein